MVNEPKFWPGHFYEFYEKSTSVRFTKLMGSYEKLYIHTLYIHVWAEQSSGLDFQVGMEFAS